MTSPRPVTHTLKQAPRPAAGHSHPTCFYPRCSRPRCGRHPSTTRRLYIQIPCPCGIWGPPHRIGKHSWLVRRGFHHHHPPTGPCCLVGQLLAQQAPGLSGYFPIQPALGLDVGSWMLDRPLGRFHHVGYGQILGMARFSMAIGPYRRTMAVVIRWHSFRLLTRCRSRALASTRTRFAPFPATFLAPRQTPLIFRYWMPAYFAPGDCFPGGQYHTISHSKDYPYGGVTGRQTALFLRHIPS